MTTYTAKFKNETITRKSEKVYTVAWAVTENNKIVDKGFSKDYIAAKRSANASMNLHTGRRDLKNKIGYTKSMHDKKHGKGSFKKLVEDNEKRFSTEVVIL